MLALPSFEGVGANLAGRIVCCPPRYSYSVIRCCCSHLYRKSDGKKITLSIWDFGSSELNNNGGQERVMK